MRHVNYTYVPDCPKCGTEARQRMRYLPGTSTGLNPFGEQVRWWRCPDCGWESEEVASRDFDALTERLTASQRVFGSKDRG